MNQLNAKTSLDQKLPWAVELLGLITLILCVVHVSLQAETIALVYLAAITAVLSVITLFIMNLIKHNSEYTKGSTPTIVFLCIYILLVTYLGVNKVVPESREIVSFEKKQLDLIYKISMQENEARRNLAELYLNATTVIERIQPGIHKTGTIMMAEILQDKINKGDGTYHVDSMFELAEIAFLYNDNEFSYAWYKIASEYGRNDALEHYSRLIKTPKKKVTTLSKVWSFFHYVPSS